jgi:ribonuclease P protein component
MPARLPRLTRRAEFLRAAGKGRKAGRPGLLLQALPDTGGPLRVGFTATKRLGGAVVRNRAKRRLREAARLTLGEAPPPGWDLVLVAREATATRPFATLLGDLRGALRQAGVPAGTPPAGAPEPREQPR